MTPDFFRRELTEIIGEYQAHGMGLAIEIYLADGAMYHVAGISTIGDETVTLYVHPPEGEKAPRDSTGERPMYDSLTVRYEFLLKVLCTGRNIVGTGEKERQVGFVAGRGKN